MTALRASIRAILPTRFGVPLLRWETAGFTGRRCVTALSAHSDRFYQNRVQGAVSLADEEE